MALATAKHGVVTVIVGLAAIHGQGDIPPLQIQDTFSDQCAYFAMANVSFEQTKNCNRFTSAASLKPL